MFERLKNMNDGIMFLFHVKTVVGIGAIGVAIGVTCLWLRYKQVKKPWARRLCLLSDVLNTSFVSITVVCALTLSFQLAIHLPDLARSEGIPPSVDISGLSRGQEAIQSNIRTLEMSIVSLDNRQLIEQVVNATSNLYTVISDLRQRIQLTEQSLAAANRDLTQKDLLSVISDLRQSGQLTEQSLATAVHSILGSMDSYRGMELSGRITETNINWSCAREWVEVECTFDQYR